MNYDYNSTGMCSNEQHALPEATLSDIVRENSVHINSIKYTLECMYRHLYGGSENPNDGCTEKPECMRDELTEQTRTLLIINENLARISSKLGM